MIHLSEKNLIKTLWKTTHDQNHPELADDTSLSLSLGLSVGGARGGTGAYMLVPLRRAYSEGKEFINQKTLEFDVRPHTTRDTHTATQRPLQLQFVQNRVRVDGCASQRYRAGRKSEMISE